MACAFAVFAAVLAGCSSGSAVPTSDVVATIPWPLDKVEGMTYAVKNDDGANLGRIILSTEPESGGRTSLVQHFNGPTSTDVSSVVVDSRTLKPISSTREIESAGETTTITVEYTEAGVLIKQGDKQSGLSVPEHAYDNDTSLFLWRTIAFAPGYEASYVTIITNHRSRQTVTLRVIGKESVRTAAGDESAWRLEIRAGSAKQVAWFADTPARTLLRYDNDNGLIFRAAIAR